MSKRDLSALGPATTFLTIEEVSARWRRAPLTIQRILKQYQVPVYRITTLPLYAVADNLPHVGAIKAKDLFLFLLQGNGPKGIIGFGEILTRANRGNYWTTK
jgi:hypothetical protein